MKVQGDPSRAERAISAVRTALDEARAEHASLTAGIASKRLELDEQARALSEAATVRAALGEKLGRYRGDIDARGAEVEVRRRVLGTAARGECSNSSPSPLIFERRTSTAASAPKRPCTRTCSSAASSCRRVLS